MALPENLHEAICAWNDAKPGSEATAAYAAILRAYQQAVDVAVSNAANLATARACAEAETLRWVIEELARGRR